MGTADWVGYAAGLLTAVCYIPQVIKIVEDRSAKEISAQTNLVLLTGLSLWIVFGLLRSDIPIIAANAVGSLFVFTILMLKLKYRSR